MAFTRIHQIKTTLNKALDYIENPDKTAEQLLVSGYNCDPLTASIDFELTVGLAREMKGDYSRVGGGDNLAQHMIQSFSPYDKITPEQAHEIGKQWADEILQGKYEYVISTHVDKGHIHNHIIFNSTSFYDYKKFQTEPYKTAKKLREVSDRLCEEHGLSVIHNPKFKQKSKTHYEWEQYKAGTSWKAQIGKIIDQAIYETSDYESFKATLAAANVEIKEGKRISFRITGTGQERFCRGDRISEDYSRERILERLAEPKTKERKKVMPPQAAEKAAPAAQQPSATERQPVFSSFDKKVEWQARRTRLAETKELAAALLTIRTEDIQQENDFDIRIGALSEKATEVKGTVKEVSGKNQQYKEAAKYLLAFKQYLPIKQEAAKQLPFAKKKYEQRYESELRAFDFAVAQLEKLGVNTNVDPDKVIALVKDQDGKAADLTAALKSVTDRIDAIKRAQTIVKSVQGDEQARTQEKKKERGEPEI